MKAIIFDCFGVFVDDSFRQRLNDLEETNPDEWLKIRDINHAADRGLLSQEEANADVAKILNITLEELSKTQSAGESLNLRLVEFVKKLKPHYKLGLLSNVNSKSYLAGRFKPEDIDSIFDAVVASGDEGVTKPDERIYEIAAMRLGVEPGDCLMIDDIADYCYGAEAVGMSSIHFTSTEQCIREITLLIDSGGARG